jgi:hypothetical protein
VARHFITAIYRLQLFIYIFLLVPNFIEYLERCRRYPEQAEAVIRVAQNKVYKNARQNANQEGDPLFIPQAVEVVLVEFVEGGMLFGGFFLFIQIGQVEFGPFFPNLFLAFEDHRSLRRWGLEFAHDPAFLSSTVIQSLYPNPEPGMQRDLFRIPRGFPQVEPWISHAPSVKP